MRPGCRAFIAVLPPWPEKKVPNRRVRKFEIAERKIEQSFGEEDLIDSQFIELHSLQEVEELIERWGFETGVFQQSLNTDYPL